MRKSTKKAAEAVKPTAAEVVETVKEAVTETAEKAAAKVEKAAETVKKAAETKKDETKEKKAPARKAAVKEEFFLQFNGKEISQADVMKKVKENWTKVQKKKIKDIKSVSIYMVPESGYAYYVINGEGGDDYRVEL